VAGPDESVVITGESFTSILRFMVYGQTTSANGVLKDSHLHKTNANGLGKTALITLPDAESGLPEWSSYMVWAKNIGGFSRPVLVNKSEAYWLGPDKAAAGRTTAIHGINLAHGNVAGTNNSHVYIKPADGSGQWASVTNVNPYRVQFTVPAGLATGTYEVWIHNGHGGIYGWSKSPNSLIVYSAPVWISTTAEASVTTPSLWKAKNMMTAPPRIRALPWMRSAQAQALRPPATT